jgi:hypothetical protein
VSSASETFIGYAVPIITSRVAGGGGGRAGARARAPPPAPPPPPARRWWMCVCICVGCVPAHHSMGLYVCLIPGGVSAQVPRLPSQDGYVVLTTLTPSVLQCKWMWTRSC